MFSSSLSCNRCTDLYYNGFSGNICWEEKIMIEALRTITDVFVDTVLIVFPIYLLAIIIESIFWRN